MRQLPDIACLCEDPAYNLSYQCHCLLQAVSYLWKEQDRQPCSVIVHRYEGLDEMEVWKDGRKGNVQYMQNDMYPNETRLNRT